MRGLGAQLAEDFAITDYSVALLAAAECAYWNQVTGLGPSWLTLLYHAISGTPPPGVSQKQFEKFQLRSLQCITIYDRFATNLGREAIYNLVESFGGLPDCKNSDIQGLLEYQSQHGWQGPYAQTNAFIWLLTRDPSVWTDVVSLPSCAPASQPAATQPAETTPAETTPTTQQSDPSTTPQPVYDDSTSYQPSSYQPPATTTPTTTAPPEKEKSSMMMYGLIGLAGVVGVGAIYFATRKKKR